MNQDIQKLIEEAELTESVAQDSDTHSDVVLKMRVGSIHRVLISIAKLLASKEETK